MEPVLRAVIIYGILLLLFRVAGRRTLSDLTNFDLILLIIIAESAGEALPGEDSSVTNAFIVIATLISVDLLLAFVKQKSSLFDKLVDGVPLVLVEEGRPLEERMQRARVGEKDVLVAAREAHGLERMEQIKYAVLERNGRISIIPMSRQGT